MFFKNVEMKEILEYVHENCICQLTLKNSLKYKEAAI